MSALTDVAKQALEYFHDRGCIDTYSEEWGFYLALRDALAQEPKVGEKSLGAQNSAGMDALRNAAQRQLDALGGYRREIGLLTGVPDEQPCDAEVALRAALEQQAEPAQPMRFRVTVIDNAHPDGIPLEQWVRRDPTAALRADAERYRYLLGHARRIDVDGWSISHMEQLSPRIDAAREEV